MRVRRLRRWLLGIACALVITVATGVIVFHTAWFRDWLRRAAVARTAGFIDGELSIGRLSGDLLHTVTLDDVTITQQGVPVISVAHVTARYDVIGLIRGRLALATVTLVHPVVLVEQDRRG